jgi:hypothetical protein
LDKRSGKVRNRFNIYSLGLAIDSFGIGLAVDWFACFAVDIAVDLAAFVEGWCIGLEYLKIVWFFVLLLLEIRGW